MILIADSGSTKTDWVVLLNDGTTQSFETIGFNPFHHSSDFISETIQANKSLVTIGNKCSNIYYYGAGCSSESMNNIVKQGLDSVFTAKQIIVEHDLLACALATYDGEPALSCILGTGSNSCYFDGTELSQKTPALGYVLGDEGGGSYFGKEVLKAYLYGHFNPELHELFEQQYSVRKDEILDRIYKQPNAKSFLASFAEFLSNYEQHPLLSEILIKGFEEFFKTHVCCYDNYQKIKVHFIGSIAFHFQQPLKDVAGKLGIQTGTIIKKPMDGLIKYHQKEII